MAEKSSAPPPYSAEPEGASHQPPSQYGLGSNPPPYPQPTVQQSAYPQQPPFPDSASQKPTYPPGAYPTTATTTVITTSQPMVMFAPTFGENPVNMKCPYCSEQVVSRTQYVGGALAWIMCASFLFAGFLIPVIPWFFCCVPFCLPACQDVEHYCPTCSRLLGSYRRMR